MFNFEGSGDFSVSYSNYRIHRETLEIVIQEVLWEIHGNLRVANVKLYSETRPVTVNSHPIKFLTNLITFISDTWFFPVFFFFLGGGGRDLIQSYNKSPYTNRLVYVRHFTLIIPRCFLDFVAYGSDLVMLWYGGRSSLKADPSSLKLPPYF